MAQPTRPFAGVFPLFTWVTLSTLLASPLGQAAKGQIIGRQADSFPQGSVGSPEMEGGDAWNDRFVSPTPDYPDTGHEGPPYPRTDVAIRPPVAAPPGPIRVPRVEEPGSGDAPSPHPNTGYGAPAQVARAMPVDLTGGSARVAVRPSIASPEAIRTPRPDRRQGLVPLPEVNADTACLELPRRETAAVSSASRGSPTSESRDSQHKPLPGRLKPFPGASGTGNEISISAVIVQAQGRVQRGVDLAEKGALYSARAEFVQALMMVADALDMGQERPIHRAAIADGLQALREADDFTAMGSASLSGVDVAAVAAGHRTPVLKDYDLSKTSAIAAMQYYCAFAQERLVVGCGGVPVASSAFCGLGKASLALGRQSSPDERTHVPKALVFHQAAMLVDPNNALASNELGVLLAGLGELREACRVLQHSAAISRLPETWLNLSVVHQRLGEPGLAELARYEYTRSQQAASTTPFAGGPLVQWYDAATFNLAGRPGELATRPAGGSVPNNSGVTSGRGMR